MAYTREYSSADTTIVYGGQALFGLTPDSGVTVSRNVDTTDEEIGMQGDEAISILPDKSGTVQISCQQDSQAHRMLSDLLERQEAGKFLSREPLLIKINTGEQIIVPRAHIKTPPERAWGSSANGSARVWTLYCNKITWTGAAGFGGLAGGIQVNF